MPHLPEGVGEQRKVPAVRVAGEDLDETGFEDEPSLPRRLLHDCPQPVRRERPQHQQVRLDQRREAHHAGQIAEPICADRHHDRAPEHHASELIEEPPGLIRVTREGLLALVDDQQRLMVVPVHVAERLKRTLARSDHDHADASRREVRADSRPDEGRLSYAGRPRDEEHIMLLERLQPSVQFLLTSEVALGIFHAGGRKAEVRALRARRPERDRGLEFGILAEDRLLEGGELSTGVQTEFRGEQLPPSPDTAQRVGLSPLAILRQAEDHPSTLSHRRLRDSGSCLCDDVEQVTRLQPGLEERFLCREADLFQTIGLDLCRRPVRQIGERLPAPERERLRERVGRTVGLAEFEQLPSAADQ
jgi:hypothetical protein